MVKVNCSKVVEPHSFYNYCAFCDSDGDFYLIDCENEHVVRITNAGCQVIHIGNFEYIEDLLKTEFGSETVLSVAYKSATEYEIIIDG